MTWLEALQTLTVFLCSNWLFVDLAERLIREPSA